MRPDGKARRVRIPGVFEREATPPGGMQRRPNAAGLSPRTASSPAAGSDSRSLALLGFIALACLVFRMLPLEIEPRSHTALAIGMFMICSCMTQVLDHGIAGILGCFLFWMFGSATFETRS